MSDHAPISLRQQHATATRSSIFLKLKHTDAAPRELAWRQFYDRYAPVIADYARRKGADAQRADEIVQQVICGFFEASPRFVYDPSRGRFRGYLKACVVRALSRVDALARRRESVPVDEVDVADTRHDDDDELWERLWRQQLLRRAVEIVRGQYEQKGKLETFLAFEQNVLMGKPAPDVAREMGMNVASVHTAKSRVTEKLREIRAALEEDEG